MTTRTALRRGRRPADDPAGPADSHTASAARSSRARWAAAGGVAVVLAAGGWLAVASSGWPSSGSDVALRFPGGQDFGISLPSTVADRPYSIGGIALCVNGASSVQVDEVLPADDDGIRVTDFAVGPLDGTFGADQVTLEAAGFPDSRTVHGACADDQGSQLGVQFSKPTAATARVDGLTVRWHSGEVSGTTTVPLHLVLCEGPDQDVPSCRSL
jgi:hypothetical protein